MSKDDGLSRLKNP